MSALRLHNPEPEGRPEQVSPGVAAQDAARPNSDSPQRAAAGIPTTDSTKSWLDVLEKLLPVPESERKGIRDELASHLRERVRDLTLSGIPESQAVRTAISELGDAADLAKSYSNVKSGWAPWARSNVMKVTVASVLVAGLVVGGVALRGSGQDAAELQRAAEQARLQGQNDALKEMATKLLISQDQIERYQVNYEPNLLVENNVQRAIAMTEPREMPENARIALQQQFAKQGIGVKVTCDENTPWLAFFESIAKTMGVSMVANWDNLANSLSIQKEDPVNIALKDAELDTAILLLNRSRNQDALTDKLGFRAQDGTIEFAPMQVFDRRERTTRTFDLDVLVHEHLQKSNNNVTRLMAEEKVSEEVATLVRDMVNQDMWKENGGDLATIRRYGSKIFITAPQRHFEHIEWVLKEIGAFEGTPGATAPADIRYQLTRPVLANGPVSNSYKLQHAKAAGVREALGQLFNAAPALKECNVVRVLDVNDRENIFNLTATADQIGVVNKIIALIDKEFPKDDGTSQELRQVTLSNTTADGMVEVIGRILNAVPSLVQCNVGRSIYEDSAKNTIAIVSTHDQGAIIANIIEGIDKAVGKQVASSAGR